MKLKLYYVKTGRPDFFDADGSPSTVEFDVGSNEEIVSIEDAGEKVMTVVNREKNLDIEKKENQQGEEVKLFVAECQECGEVFRLANVNQGASSLWTCTKCGKKTVIGVVLRNGD